MRKIFKEKKILKKILIILFFIYVIYTLISQQKTLNSYKSEQAYYSDKIKEQNEYKENLTATKENVNSPEFIEEIAREKLDMYLPNERVYLDISK